MKRWQLDSRQMLAYEAGLNWAYARQWMARAKEPTEFPVLRAQRVQIAREYWHDYIRALRAIK